MAKKEKIQFAKNKQLNTSKTKMFNWSLSRLCKHSTLNFIRCVWERVGGQGHPNNPDFILPDLRALSQNSAIQLWLRHVTKSRTLWHPHRQNCAYTQTLTHASSCSTFISTACAPYPTMDRWRDSSLMWVWRKGRQKDDRKKRSYVYTPSTYR